MTRTSVMVRIDNTLSKASIGSTNASAPHPPIRRRMNKKHAIESLRDSPVINGIVVMIRPHAQKKLAFPRAPSRTG